MKKTNLLVILMVAALTTFSQIGQTIVPASVLAGLKNASPAITAGNPAASNSYVATQVLSLFKLQQGYNASGNTFPAASNTSPVVAAIKKGFVWTITVSGTLGGTAVQIGDVLVALTDSPGQTASNWVIQQHDLGFTPISSTVTDGNILIGNSSNIATSVTPSLNASPGTFALSNTGAFTFPDATAGQRGWLNTTDWQAFNNKQNALSGTGYIFQSGSTTSYTTTIPNSSLANSTISGVALGSNLAGLTNGYGVLGGTYNGSGTIALRIDSTLLSSKLYTAANYAKTAATFTINGSNLSLGSSSTITAAAGTLTGATLNSTVVNSSLSTFGTSPTFTTPILGTPTSGTLSNCTGFPAASLTWSTTKVPLANGGTNADLSSTGGASQVLKQSSSGGAITVGQLATSNLSDVTTWTDYSASSTITGFSSVTTKVILYQIVGKLMNIHVYITGTSNATTFSCTIPNTSVNQAGMVYWGYFFGYGTDNNVQVPAPIGVCNINTNVLSFFKDYTAATWTASSTKAIRVYMSIPIQ